MQGSCLLTNCKNQRIRLVRHNRNKVGSDDGKWMTICGDVEVCVDTSVDDAQQMLLAWCQLGHSGFPPGFGDASAVDQDGISGRRPSRVQGSSIDREATQLAYALVERDNAYIGF